jgi:hypothetical protein
MAEYCEFVVQGQRGWTLGFIQGYIRGIGETVNVVDAEAEGFECEPLRERLLEMLQPSLETLHLVVPGGLGPHVRQAVAHAVEMGHDTEILHAQAIDGARFSFSARVYSKQHGEKIQAMFGDPPEGVAVSGEMNVKVDPEAEGVEMYAPVHEYELKADCVVSGPIDGVLHLYRQAGQEELIQLDDLELVRAEPED